MDTLMAVAPLISGGVGVGVLLVVVLLLARGDLVPGQTHRDLRDDARERHEAIREDRDYWRTTALEAINALGATVGRNRD